MDCLKQWDDLFTLPDWYGTPRQYEVFTVCPLCMKAMVDMTAEECYQHLKHSEE